MNINEKANLFIKLLSDEKFLARMNDTENDVSKMKALFASEGIELPEDKIEIIINALDSAKKSIYNGEGLSDEDLEGIAGGGVGGTALKTTGKVAKKALKVVIIAGCTLGVTAAGVGALNKMAENTNSASTFSDYASAAGEGALEGLQFLGDMAVQSSENISSIVGNFLGS